MTSTNIAPADQPSRQAIIGKTDKPLRVQGKLKVACSLMVWGDDEQPCYEWDEAARRANLSVRAMRLALDRQHVRRYLQEQRQVLRESICAANPRRLAVIRDQSDNWSAAVKAIQVLEHMPDDEPGAASRNRAPGVVINIISAGPMMRDQGVIEAKPLIEHGADGNEHSP